MKRTAKAQAPLVISIPLIAKPTKASPFDIWALGITIVIGGQYFSWNAGLVAGVRSNAAALVFMGSGYICLMLSMSEMTSTLPFAGGAYGLSRCCLGYFSGFVIGCCEALQYIAYVSTSTISFGQMLQQMIPSISNDLLPLVWFIVYFVAVGILIVGGRTFWLVNRFLAVLSTAIVLFYCIGCLPNVDFNRYASTSTMMVGGFSLFFKTMPLAAWFFVGIEALNTLCNMVEDPKIVIPKGQVSCILTLFATGIFVFFVAVSSSPGAANLPTVITVFNPGFVTMLGISYDFATIFSIPATFATIFGFILAYANILTALAHSKLLPAWIGRTHPRFHTHPYALIFGSAIGYLMCYLVTYVPILGAEMFNICMFFGFSSYLAQCVGYLYLKHNFSHLPRNFASPLGRFGAYYASVVWVVNWISVSY
ncbi:Amino Acid-Polyamine-Organocation (APC) Family [Thraustotheca clavata]|uniref:Amino Acid-Polyamine-Organocation (APC) Family n=1 Tax=Thraustotheca clavata TaxID=74557 RepID=A0A1V9YUL7_9STRA|nr:Amino Acid-Polyamine-Organocation (APC) Family [Thraustotheca clavata]